MKKYSFILSLVVLLGMSSRASSQPLEIEAHKMCPLCGMYPARYPQFNCQIVFKDGSYEAFDSAAGLLVYLLFPDNTGIKLKPVAKIYFKDYFKENWLEAGKTFFVTGSEIMGPMGIEFLAVDSEQAAKGLKEQEKGQDIIHFKEINRQYMIKAAKAGWLHYLAKNLVLK
jgi:nitrous oxide reductase accessory protein NosL